MTDITSGSGTLTRTRRTSDTPHPHYFNSFQNYCNGPKSKTNTSASSNKDYLPIPEQFHIRADEILNIVNRILVEHMGQITQYTSVLPQEFFEFDTDVDYQKYLIDRGMFKTMNDAKVINWVSSLNKLYPVRTSGNGNCLLHAVLIAMVGVHDFALHLRERLRQFMSDNNEILKSNWKIERLKTDKNYGIQSEESKFDSEWEELCDLVRYDNTEDGQAASNLQFLEAVHIFSLSNMLARPIIILSEAVVRNKHGEAISYNDLFGIYLPTLNKPNKCVTIPIVLVYDQSHFCPLQSNDLNTHATANNYLPLYQSSEHVHNQTLLPIRFLGSDEKSTNANGLLNSYLRIKKLAYYPESNGPSLTIQCAELGTKHLPDQHNFFVVYYDYLINFFGTQKKKQQNEDIHQPSYETTQRISLKNDYSSSTPPPPPPYSSVASRSNESRKPTINERRPSYGEAVNNGTSYGSSSHNNRPINQHSESPRKPQIIHSHQYTNDHQQNNNRHYQLQSSNWEPVDNEPISNGKTTNSRTNDSKLKQEIQQHQTSVRLPVRFDKNDTSTNLIDFEQKTDQIRQCFVCKRMFNDLSSIKICSECDNKKKPSLPPRQPVNKPSAPILISSSTDLVDFEQQTDHLRPCIVCKQLFNDISSTKVCPKCIQQYQFSTVRHVTIRRTPANNIHQNSYTSSDFLTPKSRGPLKIICPTCKEFNLLNHVENGSLYQCTRCRQVLNIPRQ